MNKSLSAKPVLDAQAQLSSLLGRAGEFLQEHDPALSDLLWREYQRQVNSLYMVAASSMADPSVLACGAMATTNLTTEGYPGVRYHAGCRYADEIEQLAIDRAKAAFKAQYANVQPHSGTSANQIVLFSLLKPGDTILGMAMDAGGHLTHGAKASVTGQYFNSVSYPLKPDGWIDVEQVRELALKHRPRLIICGASSYPRIIEFERFRAIADEVKAYLLADISHIAGLVIAGEHPSPIDHAHFTTMSTYKQLFGARGGMILIGKEHETLGLDGRRTLAQLMQRAVFPFFQGTPDLSSIAAKAAMLRRCTTTEFKALARRIVRNAKALANGLLDRNYKVLTEGTDNHMVLVDVRGKGLTGLIAQKALEACNIIVNKNRIPGDNSDATITSGIRLGTNTLALREMDIDAMYQCAALIDEVFSAVSVINDREYVLEQRVKESVCAAVQRLCDDFPVPHYPSL